MADTSVETAVETAVDERVTLWGPYYIDISIGLSIYADDANDLRFTRTDDKGATWANTEIKNAITVQNLACWFDQETPGDAGNLVHMTWMQSSGGLFYRTVDISDGSLGTERTVDATITVSGTVYLNRTAITKCRNGNLLISIRTPTEVKTYRSTNGGVDWTERASLFEAAGSADWALLYPANVDDGDAVAPYWDGSEDEISIYMYDDSDGANGSWTETTHASMASMVEDSRHIAMDGSIRHSDGHLLLAAHSDDATAGDDGKSWDVTVDSIAAPTITAKTDFFTNVDQSSQVAMHINQQNDDVRISVLVGGTWQSTVDVKTYKSEDGMGSWTGPTDHSENAADDIRRVHSGRTTGDNGGRHQPIWCNDDLTELFINEVNDDEIAAVVPAPPPSPPPVDIAAGYAVNLVRTTGPTYGAPRVRNIRTYGSRRLHNVTA